MPQPENRSARSIAEANPLLGPVEQLRMHSLPAHRALECTNVARSLMSPALNRAQYINLLKIWYSVWEPLEQQLTDHQPAQLTPEFLPSRRAQKIRHDLQQLGDSGQAPTTVTLPSSLKRSESWFGIAYVLKGSTLGAQVIARQLKLNLNIDAQNGASFFVPETIGTDTSAPWPRWITWLDRQLDDPTRLDHTIEASQNTFAFLNHVFNQQVFRE